MTVSEKLLVLPRGQYSASATYDQLDLVFFNGASWLCKVDGLTGVAPEDGISSWYRYSVSVADMTGATSSAAGTHGLVPAPAAGKQSSFLRGDGTWATLTTNHVRQVGTTTNEDYPILLAHDGKDTTGEITNFVYRNINVYINPSTKTLTCPNVAATTSMTAPTAASGTNDTTVATTAFVQSAISAAQSGVATFKGAVSAQSTISGSAYKSGWYWVVDTAGTYVGQTCEVGDMIYAIADKGSSYSASDFAVVQANLSIVSITNAEIDGIVAQ